ncbi:MAG: 50S ribosomal protein L6 [Deltaproteobacteria bacterium]|nr:50S ribosomal protein L6 [Deltaproteobacteria bacterium]
MSRIGKQPVTVPAGVKASVSNGVVHVEGPKGKLDYTLGAGVQAAIQDGKVVVSIVGSDNQTRANFGTARARINNMVEGVTKGWKRSLELFGVGYNAKIQGQALTLAVGFSHEVKMDLPKEVKCNVVKNTIELESADRELVGTVAARIRKVQPPEPYLGKGIKFTEEKVRRKAGKTGKKA